MSIKPEPPLVFAYLLSLPRTCVWEPEPVPSPGSLQPCSAYVVAQLWELFCKVHRTDQVQPELNLPRPVAEMTGTFEDGCWFPVQFIIVHPDL